MNLVFIGASKFGLRCLDLVVQLQGVHVVGVVTAPQTFSISYRPEGVTNVLHADVGHFCEDKGLPYATLVNGMKDPTLYQTVKSWQPDAFLVAGWYHMVPGSWRELAPAYGMHASLLPNYSGGAPLVWAMINGESKTGITLFQMDDGVDSGPVVGKIEEFIHENDTIASLYSRIEERGLDLLREYLPRLADGTARLFPQDESLRSTYPQRSPADGEIDWNKSAVFIQRFIRAQTKPYPGAFLNFKEERLTIWDASVFEGLAPDLTPGQITYLDHSVLVGCGDGRALRLGQIAWKAQDVEASKWWLEVGSRDSQKDG